MPSPRRRKPEEENEDAWLITYADMVTLLLCFFIIMFAMSAPNQKELAKIAQAMKQYHENLHLTGEVDKKSLQDEDPTAQLKEKMEMSLGASGYDSFIAVSKNEKFVSMEMASSSFFKPGSADFDPAVLPVLEAISKELVNLKDKPITIEVEGHTDDSPISTAKFPSNWELSASRAAAVVRYFVDHGFPKEKIHAVGYADTRPKVPNRDTTGNPIIANQELNRRVIIKLLKADEEAH